MKIEEINVEQYVDLVLKLENQDYKSIADRMGVGIPDVGHDKEAVQTIRLLHFLMGLQTEVGEFLDQLKRHWFYGAELDVINLAEELGDLSWYNGCVVGCD